jgi:hypothetical protein
MKLSDYYFFMPIYRCEKYPKIKYAVSDKAPLAATGPL